MNDPISLTKTERCLLNYHRTPSFWRGARTVLRFFYVPISLGLIFMHVASGDPMFAIPGYGLLLYRLAWACWKSRRWRRGLQGIIDKYEARLATLERGGLRHD